MQTVCLDQNQFRSQKLRLLIEQSDTRFVVTDAALMEMCKSATDWKRTVLRSLEYLSRVPERVVFVSGNGECMTMERTDQAPLTLDRMIDSAATSWLQNLLVEVAHGTEGPSFRQMIDNFDEAHRSAQQGHLNHDENRDRILQLVETFVSADGGYTPAFHKALRAKRVSEDSYVANVSKATAMVLQSISSDWPPSLMRTLADARAYTIRWLWLRVEEVTHWLRDGGLDSALASNLTNHEVDNHYIVAGSYCDELLTSDGRAGEKDRLLRKALALDSPWEQLETDIA